jgi:Nuclear transport factor 2 (NTF2) domain
MRRLSGSEDDVATLAEHLEPVPSLNRRTAFRRHGSQSGRYRQGEHSDRASHPPRPLTALSAHVSQQAFVAHYYQAFDAEATRPQLAALYQPQSMLSFEGAQLLVRCASLLCLAVGTKKNSRCPASIRAAPLQPGW